MQLRVLYGLLTLLSSAACVSSEERVTVAVAAPTPVVGTRDNLGWARTDGQRISGDADLTAQARADIARCGAESPPSVPKGAPGESCMRNQGYYVRTID